MRVGEAEFIEVMDVRDAEVERGEEGDVGGGEAGEEVEGDQHGAKEDFFCQGAGDVVPEADGGGEDGGEGVRAGEEVEVGLLD